MPARKGVGAVDSDQACGRDNERGNGRDFVRGEHI
jgi:hypothetical protein